MEKLLNSHVYTHVGKKKEALLERYKHEPGLQYSTSFYDDSIIQRLIRSRIAKYRTTASECSKMRSSWTYAFAYGPFPESIGRGFFRRETGEIVDISEKLNYIVIRIGYVGSNGRKRGCPEAFEVKDAFPATKKSMTAQLKMWNSWIDKQN